MMYLMLQLVVAIEREGSSVRDARDIGRKRHERAQDQAGETRLV